jgi:hypothetical protein
VNVSNIRASSANVWEGEVTPPGSAWERFRDVPHALRATGRLLLGYWTKYSRRTPYELVEKYAPPSENDTLGYAEKVAKALGLADKPGLPAIHQYIDVRDPAVMAKVLAVIALVETGTTVTADQLKAALALIFGP